MRRRRLVVTVVVLSVAFGLAAPSAQSFGSVMTTVRQIFIDNPLPPRRTLSTSGPSRPIRPSSPTGSGATTTPTPPSPPPPPEPTPRQEADKVNTLALEALTNQDYDRAIELFEEALRRDLGNDTATAKLADARRAKAERERLAAMAASTTRLAGELARPAPGGPGLTPTLDVPKPIDTSPLGFGTGLAARADNDTLVGELGFSATASQQAPPVFLRSSSLIVDPSDLRPPTPMGVPLTPANVTRDLRSMRAELTGLQEALRRLQHQQDNQTAEIARWKEEVELVTLDAIYRGIDMGTEFLNELALNRFEDSLSSINGELKRGIDLLGGETDPNRRQQLHAAMALMEGRKQEIEGALRFTRPIVQHEGELKRAVDVYELARSSDDDLARSLEGMKQLTDLAIGDPGVQNALGITSLPADFLKYGSSIVDSAYAVTAEGFAMVRIAEANESARRHLLDVANLGMRIDQTVQQIRQLETALPASGRTGRSR